MGRVRAGHLADRFLSHLGVARRPPSQDLLHELIDAHQRRVPFETLTKIIDCEPGWEGSPLPDVERYIERVVSSGGGGTCWTLARGFHWLLDELGFDVAYLYMDPGHLCLRVELDGPWYADVGYGAPLFRAYRLNESFTVQNAAERFAFEVGEGSVLVTREPGPIKRLDPTPRPFAELRSRAEASCAWTRHSFLTTLMVFGYVDGVPTRLLNGSLVRSLEDGVQRTPLAEPEILRTLRDDFGMDPDLYVRAQEIHERCMRAYGLAER